MSLRGKLGKNVGKRLQLIAAQRRGNIHELGDVKFAEYSFISPININNQRFVNYLDEKFRCLTCDPRLFWMTSLVSLLMICVCIGSIFVLSSVLQGQKSRYTFQGTEALAHAIKPHITIRMHIRKHENIETRLKALRKDECSVSCRHRGKIASNCSRRRLYRRF
jgi:hypothetical protein